MKFRGCNLINKKLILLSLNIFYMIFVKNEEYTDARKTWFDYFQNNFKQDKADSHPSNFIYVAHEVPHSFFTAVDVYFRNEQFVARYLIVVVRDGDPSRNTPKSYESYLDENVTDLPSPVESGMFSKGIAVLFVDEDDHFKDILIGHDLRISSN